MRTGDLLGTKLSDVRIKERRIEIYEGEKERRRSTYTPRSHQQSPFFNELKSLDRQKRHPYNPPVNQEIIININNNICVLRNRVHHETCGRTTFPAGRMG
ncbi:MAG: hypothetical protein CSYNP_04425 [Syntrophus sp. SKADARSKE-3]|nr:hypothetical protein [Syntrophus sp. SKADARSKE-3]